VTTIGCAGIASWVCVTLVIQAGRPLSLTLFTTRGVGATEARQLRGTELSSVGSMSSSDGPSPSGVTGHCPPSSKNTSSCRTSVSSINWMRSPLSSRFSV